VCSAHSSSLAQLYFTKGDENIRRKSGGETRRAGAAAANLSKSVSNPPTLTEMQNIQAKINDLVNSLRAEGNISP
jgi:hypothetical protein